MNSQSPEATGDLQPEFDDSLFEAQTYINHVRELTEPQNPVPHVQILAKLLDQISSVDFRALAELKDNENPRNPHYQIIAIKQILNLARLNNWGLCRNQDFIYLYNGAFWRLLDQEELKTFLGKAAEKMGVDEYKAEYFLFRDQLFKQFLTSGNLPKPEKSSDVVLINLLNGTFEISPNGIKLRPFDPADFITYQLPFVFDPNAKAPLFETYLNKVLPDQQRQMVLAEYLGYVFVKSGYIKEEKVLFLLGKGANGKSVFQEIVKALLGTENTSQYTLQELTNGNGYYRAMIANKLVNYASEISGYLEAGTFKQLASGEDLSARLPYGRPMIISNYAKLIFNANELPRNIEQTNAFFRRFLIVPFDVTISEEEQDKQLHLKIIAAELSGVFNWVLEGLNRLLNQKQFTFCEASQLAREQYKAQSDSVKMFIEENGYQPSSTSFILVKDLYPVYRRYCVANGFTPLGKHHFIEQLMEIGVIIELKNIGNKALLTQTDLNI